MYVSKDATPESCDLSFFNINRIPLNMMSTRDIQRSRCQEVMHKEPQRKDNIHFDPQTPSCLVELSFIGEITTVALMETEGNTSKPRPEVVPPKSMLFMSQLNDPP